MKPNLKPNKYIDQETYEWTREQSAKDTKENFVYLTIGITALAVYASYAYLLIQKLRA
jgi:hypothetical protein